MTIFFYCTLRPLVKTRGECRHARVPGFVDHPLNQYAGARALLWYNNYLLSGGMDGFVRCWDPSNGELIFEVDANSPITSMAISPDQKWISVGTLAGQVASWLFASPDKIIKKRVGEKVCGVGFPIDDHTIVICGESGEFEYIHIA